MSEWESHVLRDVVERVAVKNSAGHERVMTVSAERGLVDQESFFTKRVASRDVTGYWVIAPGDFVYNKSTSKTAPWGVVARYQGDQPAVVTSLYIAFRPKVDTIDPDFLLLACNGFDFFESLAGRLREGARSHGLLNVRLDEFFSARVVVPPLAQQRRIVHVASAVDAQIASVSDEVDRLRRVFALRKAAVFTAFESEGVRIRLGDVLEEIKRPITVKPTASYRQIGIRSHGRGVFTKDEVTGEELRSKKVFWVQPGDLVINIVFAWEGAVAVVPRGLDGYCGSHRFPTYRRLDGGDVDFFRFFFSTPDGLRLLGDCSPGGAGRNRTLNRRRLMDAPISIPSASSQEATVGEFRSLERTLSDLERELASLRRFRSALLASLLNQDVEIPEPYDALLEAAS